MPLEFDWDEAKARENARKHRVTFDEAETAFADERSIDIFDPDHSEEEDRFVKIGMSFRLRLLVVVFVERESRVRIISARRATRNERKQYDE